jgi:hypothetical protein
MPKNLPPDDESLYASEGAPAEATAPEEAAEGAEETAPESIDEEEAEGSTAIVDKKVLSPDGKPLKEGDEVVLTVVKCYGEECEVRYAPKKSGGEVQPPGGMMMDESNAELDAMNQ